MNRNPFARATQGLRQAIGLGSESPSPSSTPQPANEASRLRRMLAYCLVHAEAARRHRDATFAILAADPTIGTDHPAFAAIADSRPTGWNTWPSLVEAALGRKLADGESPGDGLEIVVRMIQEKEQF